MRSGAEAARALETVKTLVEMGEDPLDMGGYFIISGTERVLISLEDLAPNRVMVEYDERYGHLELTPQLDIVPLRRDPSCADRAHAIDVDPVLQALVLGTPGDVLAAMAKACRFNYYVRYNGGGYLDIA